MTTAYVMSTYVREVERLDGEDLHERAGIYEVTVSFRSDSRFVQQLFQMIQNNTITLPDAK